jgi:hypothetical protein
MACLISLPAIAAPPPKVVNANDGILAAFQSHPLVGLGEWHGLAQEMDFYAVLVRDPRFAKEVGNIVLETGDAAEQATADRYVDGENVPYRELRKIWSDTVGWVPTVQALGSINLYAVIRAVNQSLPPQSRIKVWLGEPPIDWSQIKTAADFQPILQQRDSYLLALIEREILSKGKKALVIYGADHFGVYPGGLYPKPSPYTQPNLRFRLDASHPGALFVVLPYLGYTKTNCMKEFEKNLHGKSAPSLVFPIRGSSLEDIVMRPDCVPFAKSSQQTDEQWEASLPSLKGAASDAFLYLGPRKSLTTSPIVPDLYLDLEFRAEIDRRMRLRTGNGLVAIPDPAYNPATARPYALDQ